jgi:hypothetical protein
LQDLVLRAADIAKFNALATGDKVSARATIEWKQEPYEGPGHALFYWAIELGGFVAYAIVQRRMNVASQADQRVEILLDEVESLRIRVLTGTLETTQRLTAEEVKTRAAEVTGAPVLVLTELEERSTPDNSNALART